MEYDLDSEDKAWLEKFNGGQDRLPAPRFELLLWKLEMVNADANDRQSAALGELKRCKFIIQGYVLIRIEYCEFACCAACQFSLCSTLHARHPL